MLSRYSILSSSILGRHLGAPDLKYLINASSKSRLTVCNSSQQVRNISERAIKFMKTQQKLLQRDNIPESFELIYKNPMDMYLTVASTLVTLTTAGVCTLATYKYIILGDSSVEPLIFGGDQVLAADGTEVAMYLGMLIFFSVTMKSLARRTALRVYNNDRQYVAVFRGALPGMIRTVSFSRGQAQKVAGPSWSILPWADLYYRLAGHKVILMDHHFRTPYDMRMMTEDS